MKNIYIPIIIFLLSIATIGHSQYKGILGSINNDSADKVIEVNDDIYIIGQVQIGLDLFATFSKVNKITGATTSTRLQSPTNFTDFVYDPNSDKFLAIGNTSNIGNSDNNSILYVFDRNCSVVTSKVFNLFGREIMVRVILHPNPINGNFPFYILMRKNPVMNLGVFDHTALINLDINLNINWYKEISETNGNELEIFGMNSLLNGDLVLVGAKFPGNHGAILRADGNGNYLFGLEYTGIFDLYHAMELSNNDIIVSGQDFSNGRAVLMTVDKYFRVQDAYEYPNADNFKEFEMDAVGNILTVCHSTAHGGNSVLYRFASANFSNIDFVRTYFDSEISTTLPHIFVSGNNVTYVDSRDFSSPPFGGSEVFWTSIDHDFGGQDYCNFTFSDMPNPLNVTFITEILMKPVIDSIVVTNSINTTLLSVDNTAFCNPELVCDFTYNLDCFDVNFSSVINGGVGPYVIQWDIDCNTTIDHTGANPVHSFSSTNASYCVEMIVTDATGQQCRTQKTIVVEDTTPPIVECAKDVVIDIPWCQEYAPYSIPTVFYADDCSNVTVSCTSIPTTGLPCGNNVIVCTYTDDSGNVTTCTHTVTVNCLKGEIADIKQECDISDPSGNSYDFSIVINDFTGATNCFPNVMSGLSNVTINSQNFTVSGSQVYFNFNVTFSCPLPVSFPFTIIMDCYCPGSMTKTYTLNANSPLVCCKSIRLENDTLCNDGNIYTLDIDGIQYLCDIKQVRYYVSDAPCLTTPSGMPFQVSNIYRPLLIDPILHSGNICVYAEIEGNDPCELLSTNVAKISFCDPLKATVNQLDECYLGGTNHITQGIFVVNIMNRDPDCTYQYQWYDGNSNIITGATDSTYAPINLSNLPQTDCYKDFPYSVVVSNSCSSVTLSTRIRLDNANASLGTLDLNPYKALPLCWGDDATIEFTPNCSDDISWEISHDGTIYSPMSTAGRTLSYNTNRLYQDTWYQITGPTTACPALLTSIYIPVRDKLTINKWKAIPMDACYPDHVELVLDFLPTNAPAGCNYNIEWYKDATLIYQNTVTTYYDTYLYYPGIGESIEGNYWVKLTDNCCGHVVNSTAIYVDPPVQAFIVGPCFRCKDEIISLTGVVKNIPPGFNCTYQWYNENGLIPGETGLSLQVDPSTFGTYRFQVNCTKGASNCSYLADFDLRQCGPPSATEEYDLISDLKIYPNPTNSLTQIEFSDHLRTQGILVIYDNIGKKVFTRNFILNGENLELDLSSLTAGSYFVSILINNEKQIFRKLIKID